MFIENRRLDVLEYNRVFYPAMNKARGFIQCLNHALEKSGHEAEKQVGIIGWDDDTRQMILEALEYMDRRVRHDLKPAFHAVYVDGEKVCENPEFWRAE